MSPQRALVGVIVAGLLLRPQVVGMAPLIPEIRADLGGSFFEFGLLTTVPVLLMGTFALLAARAAGALGTFLAITLALAALAAAGLVRAWMGDGPGLVLATIPIGIGMGIAGALAPAVIKETQIDRPARAAGAHVAGLVAGAGIASAVVVPIAESSGSWRIALFVLAALTVVGTMAWVGITGGRRGTRPARGGSADIPWRRLGTWVIVAIFAVQALIFWGLTSWLATAYQERGWMPAAAGGLNAILNLSPLIGAISFSTLGDRFGTRRRQLTVASVAVIVGTVIIAGVPAAVPIGALLAGSGLGAQFALAMTLPLDASRSGREAAALTGLVFVIGFGLAAVTPTILGALADLTGSFTPVLWSLVGASVVLLLIGRSTAYLRMRPVGASGAGDDRLAIPGPLAD